MTYEEEQLILKRIEELEKHQKEQDSIMNKLYKRIQILNINYEVDPLAEKYGFPIEL